MLKIGQKVTYIRQIGNEFAVGQGTLKGLGLDAANREIALVRDGEKVFNVAVKCLNRNAEFNKRFKAYVAQVTKLTTEGNAKSQAIVKQYNDRLDLMHNDIVGKPISTDKPEPIMTDNGEGDQPEGEKIVDFPEAANTNRAARRKQQATEKKNVKRAKK